MCLVGIIIRKRQLFKFMVVYIHIICITISMSKYILYVVLHTDHVVTENNFSKHGHITTELLN